MMEAVHTSETSVNIYLTTRQFIPEDSKIHTRRRENLKSQTFTFIALNVLVLDTYAAFVRMHPLHEMPFYTYVTTPIGSVC
jgi:hypothetical protein